MKTEELLNIVLDGASFGFNNSNNNSGYVEAEFDNGAVVLKATSDKNSAISSKELKRLVK